MAHKVPEQTAPYRNDSDADGSAVSGNRREDDGVETLGSKLAEIEAAEARRAAELEAAELARVKAAAREEKEEARSEFEAWKNDAILAITAGRQPLALSVPHWMEGREDIIISNPKHRDHDLFLELQRWAQDEGMEILVDYDRASSSQPRLRLISSRSGAAALGNGPSVNKKPQPKPRANSG